MLEMHLERAHNVSLEIVFALADTSREDVASLWGLISNHLPRCRSLQISGAFDPDIVLPFQGSLDRLGRLHIFLISPVRPFTIFQVDARIFINRLVEQGWGDRSNRMFEHLDSAPKLLNLRLSLFHSSTLLSIPVKSLTSVALLPRTAEWTHITSFLGHCPNLVSLTLVGSFPTEDQFTLDTPPLILPKLEVLSVESPEFGRLLVTPALRELCCSDYALAVGKTAPLPALDHLELILPPESLLPTWQPTSSLWNISKLTLTMCIWAEHILETLLRPRDGGANLTFPLLRKLSLKECSASPLSPTPLCTLVLKVLNLRPELKFECDSDFFTSCETSAHDQYGTRIHKRPSS